MKRVFVVIAVLLVFAALGFAQEKVEFFGGYQFSSMSFVSGLDPVNARQTVPDGWNADLNYKLTRNFGVVADVSGAYKDFWKAHSFMFGPRFSVRSGRLSPFVEALGGVTMFNRDGGTRLSLGGGGGLDVLMNRGFAFRMVKADFILVRTENKNFENFRVATGLVFKF